MKTEDSCDRFAALLDDQLDGELGGEEEAWMRAHAGECRECALLLEMERDLREISPEDLEEQVPEDMVRGMWPRLRRALPGTGSASGRRARDRSLFGRWLAPGWMIPALGAALVLLLIGNGLLMHELREIHQRERTLLSELARPLRASDQPPSPVASAPASIAATPLGLRTAWEHLLARQDEISVAEARALLARLQPETVLLNPRDAEWLLRALVRRLPPAAGARPCDWQAIEAADGLQVAEALQLIDQLGVDPALRIPTSRLVGVTRQARRGTGL